MEENSEQVDTVRENGTNSASSEQVISQEKEELAVFVTDLESRLKSKLSLRESNKSIRTRPEDSYFKKLDSSLKKNSAFVKRLKNLTDSQKTVCMKDIKNLNLTKYISELASAITEAKPKMSDVPCFIEVCSELYKYYSEFSMFLMECWSKIFLVKKDEKPSNLSKLRVDLRMICELAFCGVIPEAAALSLIYNYLEHLVIVDKYEHNYLSTFVSFCKVCGENFDLFIPKKYIFLAEKYNRVLPKAKVYSSEKTMPLKKLVDDYFASVCSYLVSEHGALQKISQYNKRLLRNKGELSQERQDMYQKAHSSVHKIKTSAQTLADLVNSNLPDLPEEIEPKEEIVNIDVYTAFAGDDTAFDSDTALWEDEDSKEFYETLKDLKAILPGILFKDTEKTDVAEKPEGVDGESIEAHEELDNLEMDVVETDDVDIIQVGNVVESGDYEEEATPLPPDIEEDVDMNTTVKHIMDTFIQTLPSCVNRERIDRAAEDFCLNMNTKVNRRKLARALYLVQRTRLDLLPFYSRLVATLHPCMPDVGAELCSMLKSEFKWHIRKKDQIKIESKIKTMRFIAELTKFGVFSKSDALTCFRQVLVDFKHHNIDMACAFLEGCGRYLYRSPTSHNRCKILLDQMMRKKAVQHMQSRYVTMIENAYYYCNPPKSEKTPEEVLPIEILYMKKLIYSDLCEASTEKVLRQLKKFPLKDVEISRYLMKTLHEVWNVQYDNIEHVASIISGMLPFKPDLIEIVYRVIEDIRIGMESNNPKYNQRRVCQIKFLGELYNYRMADSQLIFKTLYSLIMFGAYLNINIPSLLDPPTHLFRINLVCTLLETCGQFFDKGNSKVKLDCFLKYFLRYWWYKRGLPIWTDDSPFPVIVNHMVCDTLYELRPGLELCQSYAEAARKVEEMEEEMIRKYNLDVGRSGSERRNGSAGSAVGVTDCLGIINEAEENEEFQPGLAANNEEEEEEYDEDVSGSDAKETGDKGDDGGISESDEEASASGSSVSSDEEQRQEAAQSEATTSGNTPTAPKFIECEEDECFQSDFDHLLTSSIAQQSSMSTKVAQVDIAVPMHLRGAAAVKKQSSAGDLSSLLIKEESTGGSTTDDDDGSNIKFVMLTRKGNKQQYKTLKVPVESMLASNLRDREAAEKAEKQRVKELTLNINERQEEEEQEELIASLQRPLAATMTYTRKAEFKPQKGVPDVDKIFGYKRK